MSEPVSLQAIGYYPNHVPAPYESDSDNTQASTITKAGPSLVLALISTVVLRELQSSICHSPPSPTEPIEEVFEHIKAGDRYRLKAALSKNICHKIRADHLNAPYIYAALNNRPATLELTASKLSKREKLHYDFLVDAIVVAHIWKYNKPITLLGKKRELMGAYSPIFLETIVKLSSKWLARKLSSCSDSKENFYLSFSKSIARATCSSSRSPELLLKRITRGEVTSIATGWDEHEINISFFRSNTTLYMSLTNRGYKGEEGIAIYYGDFQTALNHLPEALEKFTKEDEKASNEAFICKEATSLLGLKKGLSIPHKKQSDDNCCWISSITGAHAQMLFCNMEVDGRFCQIMHDLIVDKNIKFTDMSYLKNELNYLRNAYKTFKRSIMTQSFHLFYEKHKQRRAAKAIILHIKKKTYQQRLKVKLASKREQIIRMEDIMIPPGRLNLIMPGHY
ncbi:MAG: hypothetical protein L7U87_06705 [Chlamydiales bacterium]|nr:hypothetical protein [Chlamydiales bacterium]